MFFDKMESEIRRTSNRNLVKRSEFPNDMPSLAMSYVRQNNDLRKTLKRFEKEKQKQMRSIDGDIWELQKFMQELQCVTAISAEDILPSEQRKPVDRRLDAARDKSKKSQNEKVTSLSTEDLPSTVPGVCIDGQKVGNDQANNEELVISNSNQQRNVWRHFERRRSSSVGEMCSGSLERLRAVDGYKQSLGHRRRSLDGGRQPLLTRRRSLDAGRQPLLQRRRSLDAGKGAGIKMSPEHNIQNTMQPCVRENISGNAFHINKHPKLPVTKMGITSDNFEYVKFNALQRASSLRSVLYQRPPSTVIEEAIVEASSQETENLTGPDKTFSKTNSPLPDVAELPGRKDGGGLLTRTSTSKLLMRRSSLGTRQLNDSNIKDERMVLTRNSYPSCGKDIERKLHWQETLGYKETTSSRLRKQISRDSAIGLTSKERNKSFCKINSGAISTSLSATDNSKKFRDRISPDIPKMATKNRDFPIFSKALVALISPKLNRKYGKDSGSAGSQQKPKMMEKSFSISYL